jgi:hypothetical protein
MAAYPSEVSAKDRKKRLRLSNKFRESAQLLEEDSAESLEKVLKDKKLNKEHKIKLLNDAKKIKTRIYRKDIFELGDKESLKRILDSVILSSEDKIRLIRSSRRKIIHKIYGDYFKMDDISCPRRLNRHIDIEMSVTNISEGFESLMKSIIFTEDEKNKVIFNMDKIGISEFGEAFDIIQEIQDIEKLYNGVGHD